MSRRAILAAMTGAIATIVATTVFSVPARLVWNASASVPIGLYTLDPSRAPALGDLVAVLPDQSLAQFLVRRGYIGAGVPLIKHVAALPGQRVCRDGLSVSVDGVPLGDALERDRFGRPLPAWRGCIAIAAGQIFLMNPAVRDSLDGRYFGPIPARFIFGVVTALLTDEAGTGRFIWRAQTAPPPPNSLSISSSQPSKQKEYAHAHR
ncbi:S26 family signal peptidase [Shinella sp. NM-101]|uniref:S26 family signal peptidase n=1 Tax=Shinella sp. NM-101 TaxID=2744455 RepID=UPI001F3D7E9C|nr:S26 family signal peptidase [Shinella sp. NM-101]